MTKVKYEEMFPEEFKEAIEKNPIAYLPLGSLEYHGYHDVLGLDALKAWKICELAALKIGGVVFPPLYLGVDAWPDLDLEKYPNKKYDCYHVDVSEYQKLLEGYFYRMSRIGFKKVFVLAGHYPNAEIALLAAKTTKNIQVSAVKEPDLVEGEKGDHAGVWETSLMMVLFPELVDLKKMEGKEDKLRAVEGEDPAKSTKEHGQEILNKILQGIEQKLK
jgi:creatinine amidohydrolase